MHKLMRIIFKLFGTNNRLIDERRNIEGLDFVKFGWPKYAKNFDEFQPFMSKINEVSNEEGVLMWTYIEW